MDRGPYRPAHPTQRTTANRPTAQAHSEAKPAMAPSVAADAKSKARVPKDKRPSKVLMSIILGLVVLAFVTLGWFAYPKLLGGVPGIDSGKYQAVFLAGGQVYFGKLQSAGPEHMKLTNVFYIQTNEATESKNPQENDSDNANMQLIKLGNEVHGPEDAMIISRDQILFYENLKDDGKVVQTIKQHQKQQ